VLEAVRTLLGPNAASRFHKVLPTVEHRDPLWRVLDTFDWFSPRFQWLHDEEEVKRWFLDLGFEDVRRLPERTMVSVVGRPPLSGARRTPLAGEERRAGAVAPAPAWLPRSGPVRDAVLLALLSGSVAKGLCEGAGEILKQDVLLPAGVVRGPV